MKKREESQEDLETVLQGFDRFLSENAAPAQWILVCEEDLPLLEKIREIFIEGQRNATQRQCDYGQS